MDNPYSEVLEFMTARRSVPAKTMSGPGPSEESIRKMIEIAARVPDHGKITPWRFQRYDPDYCRKLGGLFLRRALALNPDLSPDLQEIELTRFTRVPVVIAVLSAPRDHPKVPQWEQVLSAGAAAMNLLIAANAYGWDAQWLTEWIAFDEKLAEPLGVRRGERIAAFIYIGTRTMPKTERDRPKLEDIYSTFGE
ncbi:MAG: nitroreductase family protein [Rhizobiaceae bacterium]